MSDTVSVAIVSSSGTALTAIAALVLNYRLFNSLERRIEVIERDLRESLGEHDKRISRLEDKS